MAPLFIRGKVEFGVITQSAMAFATLLGAFSAHCQPVPVDLIVRRRDRPAKRAGRAVEKGPPSGQTGISVVEDDGRIAYEGLTLYSAEDGREVLRKLTADIPRGTRVLIIGPNESRSYRPCSGRPPASGARGSGRSSVRRWRRSFSCPSDRTCHRAHSETSS